MSHQQPQPDVWRLIATLRMIANQLEARERARLKQRRRERRHLRSVQSVVAVLVVGFLAAALRHPLRTAAAATAASGLAIGGIIQPWTEREPPPDVTQPPSAQAPTYAPPTPAPSPSPSPTGPTAGPTIAVSGPGPTQIPTSTTGPAAAADRAIEASPSDGPPDELVAPQADEQDCPVSLDLSDPIDAPRVAVLC